MSFYLTTVPTEAQLNKKLDFKSFLLGEEESLESKMIQYLNS